ncbi:MAG: hypothetical protein WCH62_04350, partial [Candidatus Omnitrophota bacterium]
QVYYRWAIDQIHKGRKFILFDYNGFWVDSISKKEVPQELAMEFLHSLGLEDQGNSTNAPGLIQLVSKESSVVEFERTLDGELENYLKIVTLDPKAQAYLRLKRADKKESDSSVVVTTAQGALALQGYVLIIDPNSGKRRWRLNPFVFFELALDLKGRPRFDTTTLFGRRIFYSHIDGDGFINISQVKPTIMSGQIIFDEILKKYSLPFTVSLIEAEVSPKYLGSPKAMDIARDIFKLDNVEIGAHSFTHPLDWQRQWTAYPIKGYTRTINLSEDPDMAESRYAYVYIIKAPRSEFLKREIDDEVGFLKQQLAPKDKKVAIYQWTGSCVPPAEGIARTRDLGIRNINGGDTRLDRSRPSYTSLAPLVRSILGEVQILASSTNENLYTNHWLGPFYGFRYVIETYQQTEYPTLIDSVYRRVAPINIYYHFYSGEKDLSLDALKQVYDYALTQPIISVFTSEYASVVEGFLSGQMDNLPDGGWHLKDYGNDRTVRFDRFNKFPDLQRSKGVLGFLRWKDYLYVHLDDHNEAVLYFQDSKSKEAYLESASSILLETKISQEKIEFQTHVFAHGTYEFINMSPGAIYEVTIYQTKANTVVLKNDFQADKEGHLKIEVDVKGKVLFRINRKI